MPRIRILLVDDDPLIRSLARELLEKLGYEVETAGHGEEVLARFHQDPPPDLVILDYHLPGLSGLEVMRRLMTSHPGAKVLMASGFFSNQEMAELRAAGAAGFLYKPFRILAAKSLIEDTLRVIQES
jgi:two-component system, cell cycle sensor histidine kinase and response regulator CckA